MAAGDGHGGPPEVWRANEIAAQFAAIEPAEAATAIANHIRSFWDPRMRRTLSACAQAEDVGLEPSVLAAVRLLDAPPEG
jgi:formate dehydrogenase subunit delta